MTFLSKFLSFSALSLILTSNLQAYSKEDLCQYLKQYDEVRFNNTIVDVCNGEFSNLYDVNRTIDLFFDSSNLKHEIIKEVLLTNIHQKNFQTVETLVQKTLEKNSNMADIPMWLNLYYQHKGINPDGNCWLRATLSSIFTQVIHNQKSEKQFLETFDDIASNNDWNHIVNIDPNDIIRFKNYFNKIKNYPLNQLITEINKRYTHDPKTNDYDNMTNLFRKIIAIKILDDQKNNISIIENPIIKANSLKDLNMNAERIAKNMISLGNAEGDDEMITALCKAFDLQVIVYNEVTKNLFIYNAKPGMHNDLGSISRRNINAKVLLYDRPQHFDIYVKNEI